MTSSNLCLHRLFENGPRCVLNNHEDDQPDNHGYSTNVSYALIDECLRRAKKLRWTEISIYTLERLRAGDVSALPEVTK